MEFRQIAPTMVCGLSIAVLAQDEEARLCLNEPEQHIESVVEQPTNAGKFETVAEVRSGALHVHVFDDVNLLADSVNAQLAPSGKPQ